MKIDKELVMGQQDSNISLEWWIVDCFDFKRWCLNLMPLHARASFSAVLEVFPVSLLGLTVYTDPHIYTIHHIFNYLHIKISGSIEIESRYWLLRARAGAGGVYNEKNRGWWLKGRGFLLDVMTCSKIDSGNGCTYLWIYQKPMNRIV